MPRKRPWKRAKGALTIHTESYFIQVKLDVLHKRKCYREGFEQISGNGTHTFILSFFCVPYATRSGPAPGIGDIH